MSKHIHISRRIVISFLLTILLLSPITPMLTTAAPAESDVLKTVHTESFAPCVNAEGIVLGREGGLLSLLNVDGHSKHVAAIVKGNGYSPQGMYGEQLANHIVYLRIDC